MRHRILLSRSISLKTLEEMTNMNRIPYASTIGSIIYGMLCTKLDIVDAQSVMSMYQAYPCLEH